MTVRPLRSSSDILQAIGARLDASPLCVMLDVDGTLAPIVPTPEQASVPEATREVVARLIQSPAVTVALVSGRAAADAWRVVNVPGVWVIGNHGLEIREPHGAVAADDRVREFEHAVADAATQLAAELRDVQGAIVENKRWTLSVHYRLVKEPDVPRVIEAAANAARRQRLREFDGKKIIELRPAVNVNKGTASVAFATRMGIAPGRGAAFYAGDDRTDEDAFRELRRELPDTVTVRIAPGEDANVPTDAELRLAGLDEVRALLEWLADRRARLAGAASGG